MAENDELLHLADYVTAGLSAPAVRHKARNHLDHITMSLFAAERSLDADDGDRARAALAEAASTVVEISRTIDELRPPRPGRAQVNLAQAFLDAAATAKGVLIAANAQIAVTPAAIDVQTNPDTVRSLFVHLLMLTCHGPRRPRRRRTPSEIRVFAQRLSPSRCRIVYLDVASELDESRITRLLQRPEEPDATEVVLRSREPLDWTPLLVRHLAAALGATVAAGAAPSGACIVIEIPDQSEPLAART